MVRKSLFLLQLLVQMFSRLSLLLEYFEPWKLFHFPHCLYLGMLLAGYYYYQSLAYTQMPLRLRKAT